MQMLDAKRPRFFQEANSQFLLPGGYAPKGSLFGLILFVVGLGLGYTWVVPFALFLAVYMAKKMGSDEGYMKSLLWHLWTYKGVRFLVASPKHPPAKVLILSNRGQVRLNEWVEDCIEEEKQRGKSKA